VYGLWTTTSCIVCFPQSKDTCLFLLAVWQRKRGGPHTTPTYNDKSSSYMACVGLCPCGRYMKNSSIVYHALFVSFLLCE